MLIALANITTSFAGEGKKALAASVERSELQTSNLSIRCYFSLAQMAILIAAGQMMQKKDRSMRL